MNKIRQQILDLVEFKLQKAYTKHGHAQWGRHEFYGILKEEVDELWDIIKKDESSEFLILEIIDVILVCIRYLETNDKKWKDMSDKLSWILNKNGIR